MRKDVLLKIYIAIVFTGFTVFPLYYNVTEKTSAASRVAGAIAYCLLTFRRCRVHAVGIMLAFLWFACNPFIQVLTMNSTKDILFGAFLSLFLLVFWQILRSGKWSTRSAVCFVVFGILTCLFRHQGIYFFAALLLFLLIAPRSVHIAKKQMVASVAFVIAFFEIFSFVCHSVMNIKPGDSREMLSVPMQQMAYVCRLKIEGQDINVSGAQLKQVETFIPEAGIMDYQKNTADNVKATFSTEAFTEDISENALTYIKLGLQNPDKYLYAFRNLTEGYIDSDDMGYKSLMFMYSFRVARGASHTSPVHLPVPGTSSPH